MNKKFAVGVISFFDNELNIQIIESSTWQDALLNHSRIDVELWNYLLDDGESLEDVKRQSFNSNMMIDIVEI